MKTLAPTLALALALTLAAAPAARADLHAYVLDGWSLECPTSGADLVAKLEVEFAKDSVAIKGAGLAASGDWKSEFRVSAVDTFKVKTSVVVDGTTIYLYQGTILRESGSGKVNAMVIDGQDLKWLAGKAGVETDDDGMPAWLETGLKIAFPLVAIIDWIGGILGTD